MTKIEENQDFMPLVLRAAISTKLHGPTTKERSAARDLACKIAKLKVF
jgi:hypothetical protein